MTITQKLPHSQASLEETGRVTDIRVKRCCSGPCSTIYQLSVLVILLSFSEPVSLLVKWIILPAFPEIYVQVSWHVV